MWFIFLVSCIVVALAALLVIWIGSKIFQSIERKDKLLEIETETYKEVKNRLKKRLIEKIRSREVENWKTNFD